MIVIEFPSIPIQSFIAILPKRAGSREPALYIAFIITIPGKAAIRVLEPSCGDGNFVEAVISG
ncbi:MAG: hypothetical protein JWR05_1422 [Mucilaginibacter sp.]|nr:hypothetical protein [Mucilaginibacter sp.]